MQNDQEASIGPNLSLFRRLFTISSFIFGIIISSALTAALFYRASYWFLKTNTKTLPDTWELNLLAYLYWILCCCSGYVTKKMMQLTCDYCDYAFSA